MPRPRALSPTVEVKAYLTQANAADLQLLAYSPTLGKVVHGEQSRIINEALSEYFARRKEKQSVQR